MANIIYDIPFPYSQFTDTKFIITDPQTNLIIPDDYYDIINTNQIKFNSNNNIGITQETQIKFIFFHDKNKKWIGKVEHHLLVETAGQTKFVIPKDPYNQLVNIHKRIHVFYNRKHQTQGRDYLIDINAGEIDLVNKRSLTTDRLDILILYSFGNENGAIHDLSQSGYITLSKYEIDRNYNPNLMAIFINGKLIDKNHILQMTNSLYKVDLDIKNRYNIEIKNLSPTLHSMIPYYKQHTASTPVEKRISMSKHIYCRIETPAQEYPHNRRKFPFLFTPIYFFPDLLENMTYDELVHNYKDHPKLTTTIDWDNDSITAIRNKLKEQSIGLGKISNQDLWINFFLEKSSTNYELKMYKNDLVEEPSNVNILMQLRKKTYRTFNTDNRYSTIVCVLPNTIRARSKDELLFSIQIKTIMEMDKSKDYLTNEEVNTFIEYLTNNNLLNKISTENIIDLNQDRMHVIQTKIKRIKKELGLEFNYDGLVDGVIGLYQAEGNEFSSEDQIYYTLSSTTLDNINEVNIFKWTISTEKNNNGIVLWNKEVNLVPDNILDIL